MARKAEPGILYYPMYCDHTENKKIKLLMHEAGSDGYWIWVCILSHTYSKKGYYFEADDIDELTLFANDECKKPITQVLEVISICLKRGLFDNVIYEKYKFLTSDRIQDNYLTATAERRRKGTSITMHQELVLTSVSGQTNIVIVPLEKINSSAEELPKQPEEPQKDKEAEKQKKKEATIQRQKDFFNELTALVPEYGRVTINNFYNYWSEMTTNGLKMRKETEKTWETRRRLATWKRNESNFVKTTDSVMPAVNVDERDALIEKTKRLAKE